MTIHPSLRGVDTLRGDRSVLTRFERVQKLIKEGKIDRDSGSVLGLPKVRTKFKATGAKKKKKEEEEEKKEGEAAAPEAQA